MAFKTLIGFSTASNAISFMVMRDWMCSLNTAQGNFTTSGAGWTVVDSFYAINSTTISVDDFVVMTSSGTNGAMPMFIRITLTADGPEIRVAASWNVSTNVGSFVETFISTSDWGTPTSLYLYGSLNFVVIVASSASQAFIKYVGGIETPRIPVTAAVSTNSVTAGASKTINVVSVPVNLTVGKSLTIVSPDAVYAESAVITAATSTSVTLDSLTYAYPTGSFIQENHILIDIGPGDANTGYLYVDHVGAVNNSVYNIETSSPVRDSLEYLPVFVPCVVVSQSILNGHPVYNSSFMGDVKDVYIGSNEGTPGITHGGLFTVDGVAGTFRMFITGQSRLVIIKED
jgi:hypothetical protein